MKNLEFRIKSYTVKIFFIALLPATVLLFNWVLAIVLFVIAGLGMLIYSFLKYVCLIGNLNEDLRELNN